jgi:3-methylcrotonyl-CoA carboxylase alpha subunit
MIAKLIVWDETREKALARMRGALGAFRVAGVANNIGFLSRLVDCRSFADADLDTGLIEREAEALFPEDHGPPDDVFLVAALAQVLGEAEKAAGPSPWERSDGWRMNGVFSRELSFRCGEKREAIGVTYLEAPIGLSRPRARFLPEEN